MGIVNGCNVLSPNTLRKYQRGVVLLDKYPRLYFTHLSVRQLSDPKTYRKFIGMVKQNDENDAKFGQSNQLDLEDDDLVSTTLKANAEMKDIKKTMDE